MEKSINSYSIKVGSLKFIKVMTKRLLILGLLLGLLMACGKTETTPTPAPVQQQNPEPEPEPELVLSSEKQMTGFQFTGIVNIPSEIDEEGKTIAIEMPSGTEITALEPELVVPDKAVYEPTGPQDFTTPINYTVTAEDGTSSTYLVTVDVALSQKEILLIISAANPDNNLNWNETDNLSDWPGVTLDGNGNIIRLAITSQLFYILPAEIGLLGSLESLALDDDELDSLPPEIGQLSNLVSLTASGNRLSSLPPEIGQLSSLEVLDLRSNRLSSLPPEIGQLSSLEILRLSSNDLSSLPPEIGQLSSLEILDLFNNNLSSLPPEIGQLSSLTSLSLPDNDLSSLPPEIGQLSSLEILSLSSNDLSSLPAEMKQLINLEQLNLVDNNLSQFDHVPFIPSGGFGGINFGCSTETNLKTLWLGGNPGLEDLNQCICDLDFSKEGGTVDIDVVPNGVDCVANNVIGN